MDIPAVIIPWPQHATEPRFSYTGKASDERHSFMLSNDLSGEERRERYDFALRWCTSEFGQPEPGVWVNYPLFLTLRIDRHDLATHFRMRWC